MSDQVSQSHGTQNGESQSSADRSLIQYSSPHLTKLGQISELTRGVGTVGEDGGSGHFGDTSPLG
jgi:hypothetical protein